MHCYFHALWQQKASAYNVRLISHSVALMSRSKTVTLHITFTVTVTVTWPHDGSSVAGVQQMPTGAPKHTRTQTIVGMGREGGTELLGHSRSRGSEQSSAAAAAAAAEKCWARVKWENIDCFLFVLFLFGLFFFGWRRDGMEL